MIFAKIKSQEEQEKLDEALKASQNKKWYRRLIIITEVLEFCLIVVIIRVLRIRELKN